VIAAMPDVLVAGHRLEVLIHPPPDPGRPSIVFLHEGLGSARQWKEFPARLSALSGCGCLALGCDRRRA
jgi:pimeloyl-ACP methyl ester carboxylesterase